MLPSPSALKGLLFYFHDLILGQKPPFSHVHFFTLLPDFYFSVLNLALYSTGDMPSLPLNTLVKE